MYESRRQKTIDELEKESRRGEKIPCKTFLFMIASPDSMSYEVNKNYNVCNVTDNSNESGEIKF